MKLTLNPHTQHRRMRHPQSSRNLSSVPPAHSIDDGTLCMNVCFKDKTMFSFRFACEIFIVGADLNDWRSGNYNIIREYMKPIPR